jgi:hypothetical protein
MIGNEVIELNKPVYGEKLDNVLGLDGADNLRLGLFVIGTKHR